MDKRLFIHIGYGKTGTTSIQKFAFNNFKDGNVFLPKTGWWNEGEGHHHLTNNLNYKTIDQVIPVIWNDLIKEVEKTDAERIFISSEQFCHLRDSSISLIKDIVIDVFSEVKIIFFVRNQIDLILSAYLQRAKETSTISLPSFYDFIEETQTSFDFNERINYWEENFSKENIIARLYDPLTIKNSVEEICKVLNTNKFNRKYPDKQYQLNNSIRPEFLELLSDIDLFLSKLDAKENSRKPFVDALLNIELKNNYESKGINNFPAAKARIIELFSDRNEYFAKKYLSQKESEILKKRLSV